MCCPVHWLHHSTKGSRFVAGGSLGGGGGGGGGGILFPLMKPHYVYLGRLHIHFVSGIFQVL